MLSSYQTSNLKQTINLVTVNAQIEEERRIGTKLVEENVEIMERLAASRQSIDQTLKMKKELDTEIMFVSDLDRKIKYFSEVASNAFESIAGVVSYIKASTAFFNGIDPVKDAPSPKPTSPLNSDELIDQNSLNDNSVESVSDEKSSDSSKSFLIVLKKVDENLIENGSSTPRRSSRINSKNRDK